MATKQPTVTAAQLRDALLRKVADLERQDREALARQIELERAGHQPIERPPPQPEMELARQLLNGSGDLLPARSNLPEIELWGVINQRRAIHIALSTLQREDIRLSSLGLAEWLQAGGEDRWLQHQRRLADALATVTAEADVGSSIYQEAVAAASGQQVSLPGHRGDRPLLSPHATTVLEAIRKEVMT